MISSILKEPAINNKESLISDILNESVISNILNQPISNNLKETLISNILKQSMANKILTQPINNKESLIEEPTINNILTQPMDNNLKESLINDSLNQSMVNNALRQPINDNLKESLINNSFKQSVANNILKELTINNKEFLVNDILNDNEKATLGEPKTNKEINNNNLEEPKINKEINNNNLEEPKITINNLEETTSNKKESTFVKTPEFFKTKKSNTNPHNNDNKSFQYSITLSLYHEKIGKNYNRVPNIKPYINNFNWENIHFPLIQQDYQNFEMNSASIALTILTMNDQKEISYLCESQHNKTREKQVNLLLLESKHYTSVKNLKSLLN